MPNVLVIGSINMDIVTSLRRMPASGETIHADDMAMVPGGKGANAAVAAARLGAEVRFVGCVGEDAFGEQLRDSLETEGIDCTHLQTSPRATGTAIVLLDRASGQNSIMVNMGANADGRLPEDDALFAWADVVLLQLEVPMAMNIEAAKRAAAAGVTVILDPAPATSEVPAELLRTVSIVSPNQSELGQLAGTPVTERASALAAARILHKRGADIVVVKLGDQGALWVSREDEFHTPAIEVSVVDTTAAGDAFTGALAVGLAEAMPATAAMEQACLVGALTCTRLGAQHSIPTLADVEALSARMVPHS